MAKVRGVAFLGAARIIGALLQLFVLREINRVCGIEAYGAFITAAFISRYLCLVDPNFAEGAGREFARTFRVGDTAGGFRAVRAFLAATWISSVVLLLLHSVAGRFVNLGGETATTPVVFMVLTGLYSVLFNVYLGLTNYFTSTDQFTQLSFLSLGISVLTSAFGLAGIYWGQSIDAYVLGMALAVGVVVLAALILIRKDRNAASEAPETDWGLIRGFGFNGLRTLPNRLSIAITSANDQAAVGTLLGKAPLGNYTQASRLPLSASESLPILQVVTPTINEAFFKGPAEFGRVIVRYSLLSLVCGLAFILLPSAFAAPFLSVWLGKDYVEPMQWVMIGFAFYASIDLFYSSVGRAFYSQGQPERVFPFMIFNSGMMLLLAFPAVQTFGLLGAVGLRALIHIAQFVPLLAYAKRTLEAEINLREWVSGALMLLAPAFGIGAAVYAFTVTPWSRQNPIITILAAPIVIWLYLWFVQRTGRVDLPEGLVRRLKLA